MTSIRQRHLLPTLPHPTAVPLSWQCSRLRRICEQTRQQQAAARYCGLGFKKARLPPADSRSGSCSICDRTRAGSAPRLRSSTLATTTRASFRPSTTRTGLQRRAQPRAAASTRSLVGNEAGRVRLLRHSRLPARHLSLQSRRPHRTRTSSARRSASTTGSSGPWPLYIEDIDGQSATSSISTRAT